MNDDKLTLYFYKDGLTQAERLEINNALAADTELAARYKLLSNSLSRLSDVEPDAVTPDMMQRFHNTIDRAANMERGATSTTSPPVHFWSFFWGAAITAALALGVGIGVWFGADVEPGPDDGLGRNLIVDVTPQTDVVPVVFQRSITNYFRESQRDITDLPMDAEADRLILILRLIDHNRLFEKAAMQNNSPELARVLRAFEPILVKLAAHDIAPEEAEVLRAQLAFELNVMLTKLTRDTSDGRQTYSERI
ncbi:MAG: hypothetical protein IIC62_04035 [Proteobacteria bacterium]|nr:hypothetical protein [Pseudomonadota bacterium]